ncbi:16434_t:CDS:2, partial [Cetraspora pellucida]
LLSPPVDTVEEVENENVDKEKLAELEGKGSYDIDISFDWINDTRKHYSNNAFTNIDIFSNVDAVNLNKLKSLKHSVTKIFAIYTSNQEAKKADFDIAKEAGLVNRLIRTVNNILYNENRLPYFFVAVLITFDNYNSLAIRTLEG